MQTRFNKLKDWFFYWAAVGIGTFVLFFLVTSTLIGFSVHDKCLTAQGRYGGDCVDALIATLEDDENPHGERNSAIWALGEIGNSRALPVLEKYYTGDIPNREPWDEVISQYELKKAIKLVTGSFNATHLIWTPNSFNLEEVSQ
jgi:hypothetical protein